MLGSLQTQFWAVRDYLSPVLRDSKFKESGRLTPDEFVAAGDYLVYKFPTWSWQAAKEDGKTRDFLPKEKQYLMQRNVPCLRRVSQLAFGGGGADEDAETMMSFAQDLDGRGADDGEDWVATHTSSKGKLLSECIGRATLDGGPENSAAPARKKEALG
ncbi:BQ5605_C013g07267 [Microbotryum silenes-dioicae]|uniref:Autophagy-related protein 3 n=1 Tax=Microbotryum silenes-dioicae TaxID=796604 RepID=A0A2X0NUA1_9BASI|nr:BQ5605_C013g07267 [Microbotryum silenes-dioicae]